MPFATFTRGNLSIPLVATAVHNGHDLRPEVARLMALDDPSRLREEDPYTDFLASAFETSAIVHRSRFEVDLNRPRETAVYAQPDDAWGLDLWKEPLAAETIRESQRLYDQFYEGLGELLDEVVGVHGGFVLYDLHSFNHRRDGVDQPPEPATENPVVNLGTGSLPSRWRSVGEAFVFSLSQRPLGEDKIDVRENVKFRGRQVAAWVHQKYGEVGCALAIECKKVWMDEWTGGVDAELQLELREALSASSARVIAAWRASGDQ